MFHCIVFLMPSYSFLRLSQSFLISLASHPIILSHAELSFLMSLTTLPHALQFFLILPNALRHSQYHPPSWPCVFPLPKLSLAHTLSLTTSLATSPTSHYHFSITFLPSSKFFLFSSLSSSPPISYSLLGIISPFSSSLIFPLFLSSLPFSTFYLFSVHSSSTTTIPPHSLPSFKRLSRGICFMGAEFYGVYGLAYGAELSNLPP